MARILRMLRAFTRFKVIIRTTKAVLASFTALFILLFCVSYVYAIIGIELFGGDISEEIVLKECRQELAENDDLRKANFWCGIYATYYFDNNFNTFARAMVVQVELATVNNWHIITEMYVRRNRSRVVRLYFVAVYLTTVVVVMNVLTAFVLEAFMSQYQKAREQESHNSHPMNKKRLQKERNEALYFARMLEDEEYETHNELQSAMYRAMRLGPWHEDEMRVWRFDRKLSKALFYEQMYFLYFFPYYFLFFIFWKIKVSVIVCRPCGR